MSFENMESAIVVAAYQALGQAVTYTATGGSLSIYAIVDNGSELFGFQSETAEAVARARVKASDVSIPKRGDTITMSDSTVYKIDSVDQENNVEWLLGMTENAR